MKTSPHPPEPRSIVQEAIERQGFLQKELVKKTGIPAATLSMFLSGQRKGSMPLLAKCADALDLRVEDLIQAQRDFEVWSNSPEGRIALARQNQMESPEKRPHGALVNWQIKLHYDLGELKITPPDQAELKGASLDLTRGKFKLVSKDLIKEYPKSQGLNLQPGESALVYALEKLSLPSFLAGRAGGISYHTLHGVSVSFGLQLDPNFEGHPFALFTNNSADAFAVDAGEPCLSVEFFYLAAEPDPDLEISLV